MPIRVYDNWQTGHAGTLGLYDTGDLYAGFDVQVYTDGTLGVRPGWEQVILAGSLQLGSTDILRGILWRKESSDGVDSDGRVMGRIVLIYTNSGDTTVYFEEGVLSTGAGSTTATFSGSRLSYATSVAPRLSYTYPSGHIGTERYRSWFNGTELTIIGGQVYEDFDMTSPTVSNPNTADGRPSGAWVHRDRAYYFGFASAPGRIYYSEAADYDNVPVDNFFDVNENPTSTSGGVVNMWTVNNALMIARADGRWNVLSGVSPETGSNRDLLDTKVPAPASSALLWNDEVWFPSSNTWGLNVATPAGVDITSWKFMRNGVAEDQFAPSGGMTLDPVIDKERNFIMFPFHNLRSNIQLGTVQSFSFVNGAWTMAAQQNSGTAVAGDSWVHSGGNEGRVFSAFKGTGDDLAVYVRDFTLDRPAVASDDTSQPIENEPTAGVGIRPRVELNEIVAPPLNALRPLRMVIDFNYWKNGSFSHSSTPSITVQMKQRGLESAAESEGLFETQVGIIQSGVDGLTWDDSFGHEVRRRTATLQFDDLAYGSSVLFALQLESVSIRRIVVEYELRDKDEETS